MTKELFTLFNVYKIQLNYDLVAKAPEVACKLHDDSTEYGCNLVLRQLDWANFFLLQNSLPFILANTPAGSSLLQCVHYVQLMGSGGFRQFNKSYLNADQNGSDNNLPPEYDLAKVTAKTNIYYSAIDGISTKVEELIKKLPNVGYTSDVSTFSQLDFIYSTANRELNANIIERIKK